MVEPENAEGENAIDHWGRLGFRHANDRIDAGAEQKLAANVGWAEAVLEIHR